MFSDSGSEGGEDPQLDINEKFAEKYTHNEKRKEKERLEHKYGNDVESESSSEDEDSDAELNTAKFDAKFANLLHRIENNDKTLMQTEGEYFQDDDFEDSDENKVKKRDKKVTLKDQIRNQTLKKMDSNESDSEGEHLFKKKGGETLAEEQARLKADFKKAAFNSSSDDDRESQENSNANYDSDDDILHKKAKVSESDSEDLSEKEVHKSKKGGLNLVSDQDILKDLYGS